MNVSDELFSYEEFKEFLGALLEVHGKRSSDPIFISYWRCIEPVKPMSTESVEVICGMISNPSEKMPSAVEIKAAIRQHRINRVPRIAAAKHQDGWQPYDIATARKFRLTVLSGIYRMQGDSKFYRDLLASKGGIYGKIAAAAITASGLTMADVAVAHEDVLMFLGIAPEESTEQIQAVEGDRVINTAERDRLLAEAMADG